MITRHTIRALFVSAMMHLHGGSTYHSQACKVGAIEWHTIAHVVTLFIKKTWSRSLFFLSYN